MVYAGEALSAEHESLRLCGFVYGVLDHVCILETCECVGSCVSVSVSM